MKRLAFAAISSALLATSASAGNITFSLPNLTFPPAADVSVTKDCLTFDAASQTCITEE